MGQDTRLTLAEANAIIAAAVAEGGKLGLKPLTVAVLDAGGHLLSLQRPEVSSTLRPQIAMGKASGALSLGVSSRKIGEMAEARPSFVASLGTIAPNGMVPVAGGVLVHRGDGIVIGAVGITGDTSDNDEACALAGLATVGLQAKD
ncbi:MAG TPA: heme-binding protein [Caulobacteraceae bacterium]|jgi:uncharacterized protein GlcG (DUF336 family)|nr:heme-binding protein [Caulobacteraceae bacterium]